MIEVDPSFAVNMFWYADTTDPEEKLLKMWKQVKPNELSNLNRLDFRGDIYSSTRDKRMRVIVHIHSFYRIHFARQTGAGKTTSRSATPRGDGRGVPKHFQDFRRFSKCSWQFPVRSQRSSKCSLARLCKCSSRFSKCAPGFSKCQHRPPLLEGFALRSRETQVFHSSNPAASIAALLVRGLDRDVTVIVADAAKMDASDPSPVESLMRLIEESDLGPATMEGVGVPVMTEEELLANLPTGFLEPSSSHPPQVSIREALPGRT